MKSSRSWKVEWAIGGLFLLPFSLAKQPIDLPTSEPALHLRHGGLGKQKGHFSRRQYLSTTRNASTTLSDSQQKWSSGDSAFIKRSSQPPPRLPNSYPRDSFRSSQQPQVTEPESDLDNPWNVREPIDAFDEEEVELPHENHEKDLASSPFAPITYQYFGRSRSRVHTADSIPFILLGPTVDHWKVVGQTLASRGFSVMACELDKNEQNVAAREQGKNLILAVLDALRWNRAIIVGCDSEATLAIEAAIQLAPERVKGLVLCGDLSAADQLARRAATIDTERLRNFHKQEDKKRHIALDSLLSTYLECPYTLIWDGDVAQAPKASSESPSKNMNSGDMFRFNRCLILGGGTAPHRRRPEQFAWALTRFVEEKVAPRNVPLQISHAPDKASSKAKRRAAWRSQVPGFVESMFSQGSLLVAGRVVASIIFYVTAMKIAVYQYDSLRGTAVSIHSLVQYLRTGRQRALQSIGSFVRKPFIVFSFFGRRLSSRTIGKEVAVYVDDSVELGSLEQSADDERVDDEQELGVGEKDEAIVEEEEEEEPSLEEDDGGMDSAEGDDSQSQDDEQPEENRGPRRLLLMDLVVV